MILIFNFSIYFSYFNPFESTENINPELIKIINGSKTKLKVAFGHFDVVEFTVAARGELHRHVITVHLLWRIGTDHGAGAGR